MANQFVELWRADQDIVVGKLVMPVVAPEVRKPGHVIVEHFSEMVQLDVVQHLAHVEKAAVFKSFSVFRIHYVLNARHSVLTYEPN